MPSPCPLQTTGQRRFSEVRAFAGEALHAEGMPAPHRCLVGQADLGRAAVHGGFARPLCTTALHGRGAGTGAAGALARPLLQDVFTPARAMLGHCHRQVRESLGQLAHLRLVRIEDEPLRGRLPGALPRRRPGSLCPRISPCRYCMAHPAPAVTGRLQSSDNPRPPSGRC